MEIRRESSPLGDGGSDAAEEEGGGGGGGGVDEDLEAGTGESFMIYAWIEGCLG